MSAPTNQQEISVTVSGDRSRALVVIPSGYNADLVDLDTLIAVARAQGVVVEDREKNELLDACSEFKATGERVEHCFASALPPKRGEDTEIVWEPGFDPDAEEERCSESSVDHYSANSLTEVVEGDAIGTIRERCPGVEGRDVLGNAIPAPRGDDGPLNFCAKSFAIGGDGRIVALTAGVLRIDRGECSIDDVLHIRGNVNFETGNIETRGSVRVTGDVKDRFVVKAQKDVYVGGLIEAATIVCGGSLTANTGMTARSTGTLDVGGDLTIGFMDEVDATVHGSVHLKREAMATTFRVGGDFDAQTAALIGGDITVGGSLRVGQLGSSSETPTTVRLGSLPMLEQEIAEAREAARDADRAFRATRSQEEQLKSMSAVMTPQIAEKMTELQFKGMEASQRLNEATERIERLEAVLEGTAKVELVVAKAIYPRVTLVTQSQSITVPNPIKGPVSFCWSEDKRLLIQRIDGKWYDADASIRRSAA